MRENLSLKEMVRKMRIQRDIDNKEKNKLADTLEGIDKIVYSCENIKYLESGRKISVNGLSQSHRFIFQKDAEKRE